MKPDCRPGNGLGARPVTETSRSMQAIVDFGYYTSRTSSFNSAIAELRAADDGLLNGYLERGHSRSSPLRQIGAQTFKSNFEVSKVTSLKIRWFVASFYASCLHLNS